MHQGIACLPVFGYRHTTQVALLLLLKNKPPAIPGEPAVSPTPLFMIANPSLTAMFNLF